MSRLSWPGLQPSPSWSSGQNDASSMRRTSMNARSRNPSSRAASPLNPARSGSSEHARPLAQKWRPSAAGVAFVRQVSMGGQALSIRRSQDVASGKYSLGTRPIPKKSVSTYPELIRGRKVNHMIDNTVALSALVHGYSGKPDLAKSVNVFYLQMVRLRAKVYFDYVASKANIADLPSRNAFSKLKKELRGFRIRGEAPDQLAIPTIASWRAPLDSWLESSDPSIGMSA